jgi:hypothetical protein
MPQHSQFLLMNASKSTDNYVSYSGITLENLIPNKNKLIPKIRISIENTLIKKTSTAMLKM